MWHKMGLATYLLCMLVKQHTGIGNGNLDRSHLSLQASIHRNDPVRNIYLKLGFICHNESDKRLTKVSKGFQEVVKNFFKKVWVPTGTEATMPLFQLYHGRVLLSEKPIDLTFSNCDSPSYTT
jgi:hypothetical protein